LKYKCPFCGGNLVRYEGLPDALNIPEIAREHPIPIMRRWASKKAEELKEEVEEKYYYRKCPKCKAIFLFER